MKNSSSRENQNGISGKRIPAALTIAGSDSGGGAGIQADLRTFSAFGIYGCSAITALTAQNPEKVAGIFPADPEFVKLQILTVLETFRITGAKTGMLYSREIIRAAADALITWNGPLVIDPVMISTSGSALLREDAREELISTLFPRASWITPNIPEAEYLSGIRISDEKSLKDAAFYCAEKFHCGIILKGGHLNGGSAEDLVLAGPDSEPYWLTSKRLDLPEFATHGTGCTFSAALTASLAKGKPAEEAISDAKHFVYESLESVVSPGETIFAMFPKGFLK